MRIVEHGPLRARVEVRTILRLPEAVVDGRRVGEVATEVVTTLEVHAGSPLVTVTTELDNRSRDHRLRAWLPLPERATTSEAECAFAVVERGTVAEGGPTERPLPTYPSRRFVGAGGLVVVHEGLLEYELVDLDESAPEPTAGALALTLLRCTGMLSNGPMAMRPLPAGPEVATPGAQLEGRHVLRYGVALRPDRATPLAPIALPLVDELSLPLLTTWAPGGGRLPAVGSALSVEGAEVSAVLREGGHLVVRAFEATGSPATMRVPGRTGTVVDLRGTPLAPFTRRGGARPVGDRHRPARRAGLSAAPQTEPGPVSDCGDGPACGRPDGPWPGRHGRPAPPCSRSPRRRGAGARRRPGRPCATPRWRGR